MSKEICEICGNVIDTEKEAYVPRQVVDRFGQLLEPVEYYCEKCYDFERGEIKKV